MKISSLGLEAFYYLAAEKNFTQAAKKLGLSQPAFSQRIKALEDHLETTLVVRGKQGIVLTEAGEKVLKFCKTNIHIEEELLKDISLHANDKGPTGLVRIGGFSSIMRSAVLPALANTLITNPKIRIQTYTAELSEIPEMLRSSQVDFVIYNRVIQKEGIISEYLGVEENVLVQSKKFRDIDVYLDHDENDVTTSSYFALAKMDKKINKRYLDDVYGLLDGVKLGLGKAILPRHLVDSSQLEILNPKVVLKVPLYLVYYDLNYYTQLQKMVIQDIKDYFKKNF